MRAAAVALAAAGVALTAACARQGAPPGGPEDRRPPVVVATRPDTFEVVDEELATARFVFDERISEQVAGGSLDDAVLVSPRTGELDVDHNRDGIEIRPAGGFREGLVYRITLLPVISDLFGNQMRDPFELVFSTGGEPNPSALAGLAWDRATGEGVADLTVVAMDTRDSTEYVARSDTGGIYAFRFLPPGPYRVVAWLDQDRDDEVDPMEAQGQRAVQILGADTIFGEIGVLQPDTSPAVLTAADVLDSVTLALRFDDLLDPLSPLQAGNVGLDVVALDDSLELVRNEEGELVVDPERPAPAVVEVLHAPDYRRRVARVRDSLAREDSLAQVALAEAQAAGDSARMATLATRQPGRPPTPLPARASGGGVGGTGGDAARTGPDGRALPGQVLVVVLDEPLVVNRAYRVATTGVVNLSGVPLGGGTAVVVRTPPEEPPEAETDSLSAAPDTAGPDAPSADTVPPAGPPSDTLAAPDSLTLPDSLTRPDTLAGSDAVRRR